MLRAKREMRSFRLEPKTIELLGIFGKRYGISQSEFIDGLVIAFHDTVRQYGDRGALRNFVDKLKSRDVDGTIFYR
jgi:hypothetical protein